MRLTLGILTALIVSAAVGVFASRTSAEAARAEAIADVERLLLETTRRSDRYARSADRVLSPLPVMTRSDEEALRRFRNAAHVARARALGVRVSNEAVLDSLRSAGRLVALEDSAQHWIVRRRTSAYVVPELRNLLELIGARFHERLADLGLPPFRFEITSALRTSERQSELRETNSNAAVGTSSHEFGTTVDVSYAAFAPPAQLPANILEDVPSEFSPHLRRFADLALVSVAARKSRELGAILSEVLTEVQDEGLALVIYERQQTVYHLTVATEDVQGAN